MKTRLLLFVLLGAWSLEVIAAVPRIGLVLSGGGARGSAHIGVLKVLEELRIPIHSIAGTSMGALVGGVYASGLPLEEMERRVTGVDWGDLFTDDPPREEWPARRKQESYRPTWDFTIGVRDGEVRLPKGTLAGQKVQLFFADLARNAEGLQHFDAFPIPFRAVATDLENGAMRVFDHGPLPVAMRASMSVPGLFAPMETEGHIYVDGGLVRNLPVDIARAMGAEVIIAVNLGSSYLKAEQLGTMIGVLGQMIAILTEDNVKTSLQQLDPKKDVLIVPELGDITAADFKRAREAIAIGEAAARTMAPQLARYRLSESEYAAWRQEHFGPRKPEREHIDEVRIAGIQQVNPSVFNPLKSQFTGQDLNRAELDHEIQRLYGQGDFERISYQYKPDTRGNLLILDAVEKSWGPGYLSFGLGLASDMQGDQRFGIRGTYRRTWINELGADWTSEITLGNEPRLYTEFYQPFRLDRAGFVAASLDLGVTPLSIYEGRRRIARYNVLRQRLGADLGSSFNNHWEWRLGPYLGLNQAKVDTGENFLPEGTAIDSGIRMSLLEDSLDSAFAPRQGSLFMLNLLNPLEAMGADYQFSRLEGRWIGAYSFEADTFIANLRAGTSFGQSMPYYDQFALGGFLNLSGYPNERFRGNELMFGSLIYYRRIASLTPPLGRGIYAGGSLEVGRLRDLDLLGEDQQPLNPEKTRYGGSLFIGADSWLGPAYLGWGVSGEGTSSIYFLLGRLW